jgi:hypothetical protein
MNLVLIVLLVLGFVALSKRFEIVSVRNQIIRTILDAFG